MTSEVTVSMPAQITKDLIQAVKDDPLCECEDNDQMHIRIGWLICAYDAMVEARRRGDA